MNKCTSNLLTIRAAIAVFQAICLYGTASASIAYLEHPEPLQRASNIRASGPYIVGSSIGSSRRLGCTMALRFGVRTGTPSLNSLFEWHGSRQIALTQHSLQIDALSFPLSCCWCRCRNLFEPIRLEFDSCSLVERGREAVLLVLFLDPPSRFLDANLYARQYVR